MAEDGTRRFLMALHGIFPWLSYFLSEEDYGGIRLFLLDGGGTPADLRAIAGCMDQMREKVLELYPEYMPPAKGVTPRHFIDDLLGPSVYGLAAAADRMSKTAKFYAEL